MANIFSSLPADPAHESFDELLSLKNIRIERIISRGHASPEQGWYDQEEHEWVIVLEGSGRIIFESGEKFTLQKGDYLNIPSRTKHRVTWTDPDTMTVWLAVHYS